MNFGTFRSLLVRFSKNLALNGPRAKFQDSSFSRIVKNIVGNVQKYDIKMLNIKVKKKYDTRALH